MCLMWRNPVYAVIMGIEMLLGPHALKSLNSIEKIQPRIMVATFNGNTGTMIISCHSPTNASDEKDLDAFYNKLSSLVRSISKHNLLIIGGDMNAQIVKNENNKFSLHSLSNRNEVHLTEFSLGNGLPCLNTKFKKRRGKLLTNTYANKDKAQLDYILMNKKWIYIAFNSEVYSTFKGVSPNHRIVTAKIQLSLHRNMTQTIKTAHYD